LFVRLPPESNEPPENNPTTPPKLTKVVVAVKFALLVRTLVVSNVPPAILPMTPPR